MANEEHDDFLLGKEGTKGDANARLCNDGQRGCHGQGIKSRKWQVRDGERQ